MLMDKCMTHWWHICDDRFGYITHTLIVLHSKIKSIGGRRGMKKKCGSSNSAKLKMIHERITDFYSIDWALML